MPMPASVGRRTGGLQLREYIALLPFGQGTAEAVMENVPMADCVNARLRRLIELLSRGELNRESTCL